MTRICLIGFGRVGEITAEILRENSMDPIIYDASGERVRNAERKGFEAHLIDITEFSAATRIAATCDIAATALPSKVAEKALTNLINAKIGAIVDVSYIKDPLELKSIAIENKVKVFVDAGLAPGFSNILAAHSCEQFDTCESVNIYVGGIEKERTTPFGLVASWSISDLLEEYLRKARARLLGKQVFLDPIEDATVVTLPGLGEFDAMPTDGLRTLLVSLADVDNMVEYTIRYRGHVELLRLLRRIGLLDNKPYVAHGCSISPRDLLVRILEENLPRKNDRVILYVHSSGFKSDKYMTIEYILDENQERLKIDRPVLSYLTGLVHAWFIMLAARGAGHIGLNAPEEFSQKLNDLIHFLEEHRIRVKKRSCIVE
ncbi:hypothetical protein PYJP_15910 [Pyrofollis japonicus]|uniref:saccharopine dehydrogenase family protein n=1 Tax=Pyrofollis japonicus TaxID=3060460 RepID=UPI00295AE2DA|nr:saccharopine dehydrogenase C-terminal domain-containing protein [Pyrofollis japonicus]BEP18239.1 hypothetical protein PYJP_15910 [Pyrofollis japonicus]